MFARDPAPSRQHLAPHRAGLALVLALSVAGAARAQTPTTVPALRASPARLGYAFEYPPILLRQRLFGLAHGTSLLAAACLDLPAHASATEDAYASWRRGQEAAIRGMAADLAAWYFGPRAGEAGWSDLTRAIGLQDALGPMPDNGLEAACTTLPAALLKPRYDFAAILAADAAELAANAVGGGPGAVPPSLTLGAGGTPQMPPSQTFGAGGTPQMPPSLTSGAGGTPQMPPSQTFGAGATPYPRPDQPAGAGGVAHSQAEPPGLPAR